MGRLTEQQAKHILFNAQTIAYPNREVPEMLKPLYTYIETVELENTRLREEAERHQIWVNDLQSGMYINCVLWTQIRDLKIKCPQVWLMYLKSISKNVQSILCQSSAPNLSR